MSRSIIAASSIALAATFALPAKAQDVAIETSIAISPEMQAQMEAVLDAYAADEPGVAVIVMRGDTILFTDARGIADAETGAPLTPNSVFRYASISKQFAAATILQMADEGLLSLDDPLSKFVPGIPGADGITILQLLNHTSGLKSYTGIPGWMTLANTSRAWSNEDMVALIAAQQPDFAPGADFSYNNSAYWLLGVVIEKVSGRPWYEEVDRRIAQPLGLSTFGVAFDEGANPAFAKGYTQQGDNPLALAMPIHASVPGPAGALSGTVYDLGTWAMALHHGKVLSPASYALMTARTSYGEGQESPFGLGLVNGEVRGRPAIGHSGGIFGFSTDSIYIPGDDVFVAVLTNSDSPAIATNATMQRLAAIAVGDPHAQFTAMPADAAAMAPLLGRYENADGMGRVFFEENGKYYTQRDGAGRSEVFPAGDGRFFYGPGSLTWFRVMPGADDTLEMHMHQNGAAEMEITTRTGAYTPPSALTVAPEVLDSYVGAYESPIGRFLIRREMDGAMIGELVGQPALPLRATSDSEFAVDQVGASVVMLVEGGVVTGMMIRQGGQEIPFTRVAEED